MVIDLEIFGPGSLDARRTHMSQLPLRPKTVVCFKWKMSFHAFVRLWKEGLWENKQILSCSWRTCIWAFGQLKSEESGGVSFLHGSDLVLPLKPGGYKGRVSEGLCSCLASAVPAGLSCLAEDKASSSFQSLFPSRQLLLGDGAGSGLFSESSWRKGDYRYNWEESGVTLLPLLSGFRCPG